VLPGSHSCAALIVTMAAPKVRFEPLPYVDALDLRPLSDIDLVVVHCTELPRLEEARELGEKVVYPGSGTGNSGHFYIERNGRVEQWVPLERVAHHVRGHNARSVGIELVNRGRYPHWLDSRHQDMTEAYPEAQLSSLLQLLAWLRGRLQELRWICGHEDLDRERVPASDDSARTVRRKLDPGPLFPWDDILSRDTLTRFCNR
jgi:N-acetylmuramoyl-L-alanine amidase